MVDTKEYLKDIKKYTKKVDEKVVVKLATRLASTMAKADSKLVACGDPKELARVRRNFIYSKLGVKKLEKANEAMEAVCKKMKTPRKNRVTFYYLVAEELKKTSAYLKA